MQGAARTCALHMLSTLRAEIGSLDQVAQIRPYTQNRMIRAG
jgi:hypothetical protein